MRCIGVLAALAALGCNDGAGGPPPCSDSLECVPICDAACMPEAALAAVCDRFLQACVCECEDDLPERQTEPTQN